MNGRLCQSSFSYRAIDSWNRLTTDVMSSLNVDVLKNRLGKLWKENMFELGAGMAEWSGELVSLPAVCRLRVQFPSPPGHATLPTTGASVTVV